MTMEDVLDSNRSLFSTDREVIFWRNRRAPRRGYLGRNSDSVTALDEGNGRVAIEIDAVDCLRVMGIDIGNRQAELPIVADSRLNRHIETIGPRLTGIEDV